ncbi:MAG TPA: ATP-binding protein, partial [Candidatus Dormibacteraeota bacterium]|nr:ATP-binding protein [Candidatus Dormibacteraeota bacterium]
MSNAPARLVRLFARTGGDVRGASLRVALAATALVLVAYVAIAGAVMLIVARNLTAAVDNRLQTYLSGTPPSPSSFPSTGLAYQEPLLRWVVIPGGDWYYVGPGNRLVPSSQVTSSEVLPQAARSVTAPTTVNFADGSEMRADGSTTAIDISGETVPDALLVVGQSLDNVTATQHNILTAELLVGPILLLAVFFGSLAVGRRVGAPIERARQRQIELTADASHELRTPLSVIEAQTSLALERERDVAWYRNAFASVGVESKRMRRLVDDLLWLARFDSTGRAPASEATDLGVLAAQTATRFEAVALARGLTLTVAVEPVSTMISAPPEWLDRLLGVLLDNACRYTPTGGTIDLRVGRRDGRVRLVVDDSGPGIPPDERQRIFDRFRRASDTPGGSGLGLAIAAAVVNSSGGRWDVGTSAA